MKIVADDKIPFLKGVLEPYSEVFYIPGNKIGPSDVADADALITRTRTLCNEHLLKNSKISFIATATIGHDHIDAEWCKLNGIQWTYAAGCNAGSVAQYIAAVLVFLSRKHHFRFEDKTIGIVGVGNVGSKVLEVAEALGMRIVLNDPPYVRKTGPCGYVSLDGLLREADIITLHVPLSFEGEDKTYHLADSEFLKRLLPHSIFINSSRGEVCNSTALKEALQSNILLDAVCDVWENEPDIDLDLLNMLAIATPHIAGYSADGKANGTAMSVQSIARSFGIPELLHWKPELIPSPENPQITIDCSEIDNQEAICRAIEATYPIIHDDDNLRKNPTQFETLRGDYPLRREFHAYTVKLINGNNKIEGSLRKLGFKI